MVPHIKRRDLCGLISRSVFNTRHLAVGERFCDCIKEDVMKCVASVCEAHFEVNLFMPHLMYNRMF